MGQQVCEWPWAFHPELLAHCILLEEPAIQVEVEHGIEHVHALKVGQLLEEVAVWMGSKIGWSSHPLASCGKVVHG